MDLIQIFSRNVNQKVFQGREKLSLQYAIRLAANPSNPAHEVTFPPNNVKLYEQKSKAIKSFGIRISPLLESANIKPQNIESCLNIVYLKEGKFNHVTDTSDKAILNIIYLIDCKHTHISEKACLKIVYYLVIAKLPVTDTSD